MNYRNKFLLIIVSTVFVLYAVVGGLLGRVTAKEGAYTQLSVFNEVLSKIRSSYVEDPNLTEVMHGALRGLLESLDSYSTYLTPDEYSRYKKHKTNGNGDVGLELSKEKVLGYVYVIHPIEGGPADKAGVKAGDVIESIEEFSTRDISLIQAEYFAPDFRQLLLRRGSGCSKRFGQLGPVFASLRQCAAIDFSRTRQRKRSRSRKNDRNHVIRQAF
jgi:carboxyl-terminal processing protease